MGHRSSVIDDASRPQPQNLEGDADRERIVHAQHRLLLEAFPVEAAYRVDPSAAFPEVLDRVQQDEHERVLLDDHVALAPELTVTLEQRQAVGKTWCDLRIDKREEFLVCDDAVG